MNKTTTLSICKSNNFSFKECLHFLDRGFNDCLYHLENNSVSRLVKLSDELTLINIYEEKENLQVEILKEITSTKEIAEVKEYVSDWFDLNRDIQPFYDLLNGHKLISKLSQRLYGTRLIGIPNLFESLCWCIIGQQINLTFAYKLKRLLVGKYGEKKIVVNTTYYIFPTPEVLANVNRDDLVSMKFSRQKIDYIINVSNAFIDGKMSKEILFNCENKKERFEKLTSIKGIGIWTANYVMMKTIRDMSCITYGDSGLNRAVYNIFKTEKNPALNEVDKIFHKFKNWESYLNFYLWRTLE